MMLWETFLIGVGAAVGANLRYWLTFWIMQRAGKGFPWGTLCVNASGCFLMGLLFSISPSPYWNDLLSVGLAGGYTTMSTFSCEAVQAPRTVGYKYVSATVLLGLPLYGLGWVLGTTLVSGFQ